MAALPDSSDRRDQRFPKRCRLTARREFRQVYDNGRKASSRSLTLFGQPAAPKTRTATATRVGITATRKTGNAVQRNRAKRILREIFRRNRGVLTPPMDLVINVHNGFHRFTQSEIERDFLKSFERLSGGSCGRS